MAGTGVYFVVAAAPVLGLIVLALIRLEPVGADVNTEDSEATARELSFDSKES